MAERPDNPGEAIDDFTGDETYAEALYLLEDFAAKEVAVTVAQRVFALEEGVVPPGSVDAADVSVTPFGSIAATDVQAALEEIVAETGGGGALDWQDPSFANGWADFGDGYGDVQYAKDDNFVYFRGVGNPGTDGVAFTLPSGYRPSVKRLCQSFGDGSGQPIEISTDGTVDFFLNPTTSASFDGIRVSL